jgi:hypothetical protein
MKIIDVVQGSPEWFACRCGIPSASNFDKIITIDGKPSTQRKKYLYQLAGERLLGKAEETYQNAAMQRGIELEPEARELYNLVFNVDAVQTGFWIKDGYGCSPDGLVGDDGLIELKCPTLPVHIGYLLDNKLPSEYVQQVQGQLLVTDREWCDFVSYYPGLDPLIIKVKPDLKFQAALKTELGLFCTELDAIVGKFGKNGKH